MTSLGYLVSIFYSDLKGRGHIYFGTAGLMLDFSSGCSSRTSRSVLTIRRVAMAVLLWMYVGGGVVGLC